MRRREANPSLEKTAVYAIVVNAIQMVALLIFVLYVCLMDLTVFNLYALRVIAIVGAIMAGWGAFIDIQDALRTRKRVRTISELKTVNDQMNALNLKLREQRHDFLNHLQVVYSLLEMQEYQDATEYLETVYTQLHSVSKVLRTKLTAFNALLQAKNADCEQKNIHFEMDIRSTLEDLAAPSWELCCIIGNLLDNAIDAASEADNPTILFTVVESLRACEFRISNNGPLIPEDMRESIFEAGVSTKGEGHGMGLNIVRQRLAELGGVITLISDDDKTTFSVLLPRKTAGR